MQALLELKPLLATPQKIAITHYYNSDYDALGSTLGLKHYLEQKAHTCFLISPNANAQYMKWLPGIASVMEYEEQKQETQNDKQTTQTKYC